MYHFKFPGAMPLVFLPLIITTVACSKVETTNHSSATTEPKPAEPNGANPFASLSLADIADYERSPAATFDMRSFKTPSSLRLDGETSVGTGRSLPLPPVDATIGPVNIQTGPIDVSGTASACSSEGGGFSASAAAELRTSFTGDVPSQNVGSFRGLVRQHDIYVSSDFNGNIAARISGSIAGTPTSWAATISTAANLVAVAAVNVSQNVFNLRGQFLFQNLVGSATFSASGSFTDSVTISQSCGDGAGARVTTQGPSNLNLSVNITDASFYGLIFPGLQGPVVTRIRQVVADKAREIGNDKIKSRIASELSLANAAYAGKRDEILSQLLAKIPEGCGCNLLPIATDAISTIPDPEPEVPVGAQSILENSPEPQNTKSISKP